MEIKKGIAVSPGVAICPAVIIDAEDVHVPRRTVPAGNRSQQHDRLNKALGDTCSDIEDIRQKVQDEHGEEMAKIFAFHIGMLKDKSLIDPIHAMIDEELVTAEYAVSKIFRGVAEKYQKLPSEFFRERVTDIFDIEKRILRHLIQDAHEDLNQLKQNSVVIARDLTPSETAALDRNYVKAMITDVGGRTSHTAIIARALGIPAVVGLENATKVIDSGDLLIVDGNRGLVIINPNQDQLAEYKRQVVSFKLEEKNLEDLADLPAETIDGLQVELLANIELTEEISVALNRGAQGIGLYRSEFLYLSKETEPSEEEQFQVYKQSVEALNGKSMTIRTFDLGADKYSQARAANPERNPFLGCRSIRYCLQNLTMFKTHLRAILRATAFGDVKIMFPLITNMMELRQAKMILFDVMEDLEEEGIDFNRDVLVGMMIEVPSAAIMAGVFATEVDFFSIGTNDLVQYTLAVDRVNENVANLYTAAHPAVLRLIKDVMRSTKGHNVSVSCCGEMAGEPEFVMLLLGLGIKTLSMTPQSIPKVKQVIRSVTLKDCIRVARHALTYDSDRQIQNYLKEETRKVLPMTIDGQTISTS